MERHVINVVLHQRHIGMVPLALVQQIRRSMPAPAHVLALREKAIKMAFVHLHYIQHVQHIVKTENLQPRVHLKIVEIQQQHLS